MTRNGIFVTFNRLTTLCVGCFLAGMILATTLLTTARNIATQEALLNSEQNNSVEDPSPTSQPAVPPNSELPKPSKLATNSAQSPSRPQQPAQSKQPRQPAVTSATYMTGAVLEVNSTVFNPSSKPLVSARMTIQVVDRGRTIPLIEESHNIKLRGGIESGETATVKQAIRLIDRYPTNTWPHNGDRIILVRLDEYLEYQGDKPVKIANPNTIEAVETDYYQNPPPRDRIESSQETPMNALEAAIRQLEGN